MSRPRICVLGVAGTTGRLVAAALDGAGLAFVPVARRRREAEAAVDGLGDTGGPRAVDPRDDVGLRELLADVDLVVTPMAAGPDARAVVAAAVESGTHLIGTSADPAHHEWVHDTWGPAASAAGIALVPGVGADLLPGDALTALAAAQVAGPAHAHVAYAVPTGLRRLLTPGSRRHLAGYLGRPVLTRVEGSLAEERLAESRRLAWFPRPVGPSHAAAVPGAEAITVATHLPSVRTVRTYVAMSSARAELLQLAGNAARWAPARRALVRRLTSPRVGASPDAATRSAARWACVVEVAGASQLGRAWAYGHDPYGLTAQAVVAVALRILAGTVPAGALAPARIAPPAELLDELAGRTDLRWRRTVTALPPRG